MSGLLIGIMLSRPAASFFDDLSDGPPSSTSPPRSWRCSRSCWPLHCRRVVQPRARITSRCSSPWRTSTAPPRFCAAALPIRRCSSARSRSSGPSHRSCSPARCSTCRSAASPSSRSSASPELSPLRSPATSATEATAAPPPASPWLPSFSASCSRVFWHQGSFAALALLTVGAILLDFGVSSSLVIGQRAIYTLRPEFRSRLNGLFMATFFAGGAASSALGGWAYARGGWPFASGIGLALPVIALAYFATEPRA